jgi:transcriptional regulator with PAS, ATPase and Fis domain
MLVGQSAAMVELRAQVARIGRTNFTALIEGESGVGKELVARELHAASMRCSGPFVAVNCAALVETLVEAELFGIEDRTATGVRGRKGKFELANGGTLFLDEIADLSLTAQAKLLRVLQDREVERVGSHVLTAFDTRVVAATNRCLVDMIAAEKFRADLYYRLSGVEIHVPPLRVRRADVPALVEHFLRLYGVAQERSISFDALRALTEFHWPGNVRQLGRAVQRAVAFSRAPEIALDDLPAEIRSGHLTAVVESAPINDRSLRAWSSVYVRSVLDTCRGNKRRACDVLDITYHTLMTHLAYGSGLPTRHHRRYGPRVQGSSARPREPTRVDQRIPRG